eukprot:gene9166-biopygen9041
MACNSQAGQEDALVSTHDALWMCHEALLPCFDSETRGTWRLVCKRTCQAVEATTRCITWDGDANRKHGDPDTGILLQCAALQRVRVLEASRGFALSGLPHSLRALEVKLRYEQQVPSGVEGLADLQMSATLSPCTALTKLEDAVLYGFADTSLDALEFCTALRSLNLSMEHLTSISALSDITALAAFSNLRSLDLRFCEELQDVTALAACSNLHTLNLRFCVQLLDITALAVCSNLIDEDVSVGTVGSIDEDISVGSVGSIDEDVSAGSVGSIDEDVSAGSVGSIDEDDYLSYVGSIDEDVSVGSVGSIDEDQPMHVPQPLAE